MKAKLKSLFIVILGVALVGLGGIYFLDRFGLVDLTSKVKDRPMLEMALPEEKFTEKEKTKTEPQVNKTKLLEKEVADLNQKLKQLEIDKELLQQGKAEAEATIAQLQVQADEDQQGEVESKYKKLADYYGQMKPKEAVPILDELDDETVLGIFKELNDDVVAKMLELMDPKRAASLVKQMAD